MCQLAGPRYFLYSITGTLSCWFPDVSACWHQVPRVQYYRDSFLSRFQSACWFPDVSACWHQVPRVQYCCFDTLQWNGSRGQAEGSRMKELSFINTSLFHLREVRRTAAGKLRYAAKRAFSSVSWSVPERLRPTGKARRISAIANAARRSPEHRRHAVYPPVEAARSPCPAPGAPPSNTPCGCLRSPFAGSGLRLPCVFSHSR